MTTLTTINKTELLNPEIEFEYFVDFAKNFVSKIEAGEILTKKKVRFSKDTIRQYSVSIAHFEEFEKKLNSKIRIHEINKRLLEAFEKHLYNAGLLYNSVYLYISKIKAIANILFDEEITNRQVRFSTPKKQTTQVYLNQKELTQMKDCDKLTESERKVLDIFLVQSFSGMRFQSLKSFLENPIAYIQQSGEKTYINIVSQKTTETSIIPLSKVVYSILNKYNFKINVPSEEFINRSIKKIASKAGIDNPIAIQVTKNGRTETVIKSKSSMISTHSARRGYISILKQYVNDEEAIIASSGHTSIQAMRNYIRSTKLERVDPIFNSEFLNIEI